MVTFTQILYIANPIIWLFCTFYWMWLARKATHAHSDLLVRIRTIEMWVRLNDHKLNPKHPTIADSADNAMKHWTSLFIKEEEKPCESESK